MRNITKIENAGIVTISDQESGIKLYPHQIEAFDKMTKQILNTNKYPYKGLLVLPTGGGKTITAARWITENIMDNSIKVLWLAHRHELLEQAKRTFAEKLAYKDVFKRKKKFRYRLVSGIHDIAANIRPDDDIIFSSKDSLNSNRNFGLLKKNWLDGNDEVFLVIDEAHHAPAKTYRKLIEQIEKCVPKFRMIGLTATPIRTAKKEEGYMAKIFPDGMVYKIDLRSLIRQGILSEPVFEEVETGIDLRKDLNDDQIKKINNGFDLDSIGANVAKKIADNNERNHLIVNRYINNREKYGKTIVFAVNKENVIALNKLFNESGVRSDFVMSDTRDASGLHSISSKENKNKIKLFRKGGDLDILINVNILTEGTDVPDVQSVFLTRPTQSTILMTQMIGRALRGVKAGGTKDAYIVTFIDQWSNKIAWVNPEKLYIDGLDFSDLDPNTHQRITRLIAISMIEEFAVLNDKIINPDKKELIESVDFIKRIPKGVYKFSYPYHDDEGSPIDKVCEVLVYDNLEKAYKSLIEAIPQRFGHLREKINDVDDIDITSISNKCETEFFSNLEHYPAYRADDITDLIRYHLITGETPNYYEFTERGKYDITCIAKHIIDNDLGPRQEEEYIKSKWISEQDAWKTFSDFTEKMFRREIMLSKDRILHPEDYVIENVPSAITVENQEESPYVAQGDKGNQGGQENPTTVSSENQTQTNYPSFYYCPNNQDTDTNDVVSCNGNSGQNEEIDTNDNESSDYSNSRKLGRYAVFFQDGTMICERNKTDMYVKAIEKAGIEQVKGLNISRRNGNIIRRNSHFGYSNRKLSNGEYLLTGISSDEQTKVLETIESRLNLGWIVASVDWNYFNKYKKIYNLLKRNNKMDLDYIISIRNSDICIFKKDGTLICGSNTIQTYVKAIEDAGIERVKELNISKRHGNIIKKHGFNNYQEKKLSNGEYLLTGISTGEKHQVLEKINSRLNLGWIVEKMHWSEFVEYVKIYEMQK